MIMPVALGVISPSVIDKSKMTPKQKKTSATIAGTILGGVGVSIVNDVAKGKSYAWNTSINKGLKTVATKAGEFVKNNLRCKYYARYVDDFIIIDYSSSKLINYQKELMQYLKQSLGLKLNNRKCFINSVNKGIDFVGYKVKPHRLYLRQKTINKAFNTIWIWLNNKNRLKKTIITDFLQTINSYLGMLKNTCSYNLRKELCFMFNSFFIYPDKLFLKACTVRI